MEEEETECDSYFNGDWYSLTEECQCITASIEYIDMGNGYYGGANGCKSCDGWSCAECYEGFMMNEWNSCVRMETTSEPSDADACELCTQNSCLGNGACLLIEGGGEFTCEVDPNHFTSQSVCDRDYGHWCSNCYECPEVMCMMYCEYGYVQDEYGCDTCVCNDVGCSTYDTDAAFYSCDDPPENSCCDGYTLKGTSEDNMQCVPTDWDDYEFTCTDMPEEESSMEE